MKSHKDILNRFLELGFIQAKKIRNKNIRLETSYYLLKKDNKPYLLKIRPYLGKKEFIFSHHLSNIFGDLGYPKIYEVIIEGNTLIELTSFVTGKVISPKAYTHLNMVYFDDIYNFFEKYEKILANNIGIYDETCKKIDSSYFIKKLDNYDRDITQKYGQKYKNFIKIVKDKTIEKTGLIDRNLSVQHGDCYASNMVKSEKNIVLIDWESPKFAPIYFDLATFFSKQTWEDELNKKLYISFSGKNNFLLNWSMVVAYLKQLKNICTLENDLYDSSIFVKQRLNIENQLQLFIDSGLDNLIWK